MAVLSAEFWKRAYLSDPGVLGRTVRLDRTPYTIVGVLPEREGLWGSSVMVPFRLDLASQDRSERPFWVTVTLKDGVTREAANAGLAALARRWERDYGCRLGGGSQAWRSGLRRAFDWLRDEMAPRMLKGAA